MHDNDNIAPTGGDAGANAPIFAVTQPMRAGDGDLRGDDHAQRLKVEFTGSGSEYFRIWIVNLLLTIVTLTLYRPFAKARRLAYFHGNTLVGGQPLGFHGDPWKMLRGYLLMLLFGVAYAAASRFSPVAAMVAVGAFVLLWPALWRASLQFRLANTSWRGLRMAFTGSLGGAYVAMLPGVLPWLGFVLFAVMVGPEAEAVAPVQPSAAAAGVLGVSVLAMLVLMPLSLAWIKRYQHNHYQYANERSHLQAGAGAFYGLVFKIIGVSLLIALASGLAAGIVVGGLAVLGSIFDGGAAMGVVGAVVAALIFYGAYFVFTMPYAQSRTQNLVWGSTRSQALRCHSALEMLPLGLLTLKNLVLVICTLGLYWPFAAIASARMRLSAISVDVNGDMAQWQATGGASQNDATGDAAGDFFGIDMGL